jgi:hypothetical protein
MTKATASAMDIERLRCKPLINLINVLLSDEGLKQSSTSDKAPDY